MYKFRKILQIIAYYILPITLLILAFGKTEREVFTKLGNTSLILLSLIVFIKPLAVIFKKKFLWNIVSLRRELGVANFWTFFFHFTGLYYVNSLTPRAIFIPDYFIFWGAMAGIGMIILSVSANNFSTRLLKKNWKRLHYITYPVFLFALYHGSKAQDEIVNFYVGASVFIILKIIEFTIKHKKSKQKIT